VASRAKLEDIDQGSSFAHSMYHVYQEQEKYNSTYGY